VTFFTFTIEGQPPSWNRSYRIVKKGRYMTMAKTSEGAAYQLVAASIARRAVPAEWEWEKPQQIRVRYRFRLKHWADATNLLKLLEDAIALGVGVDDRYHLPCVESLTSGHKDPSVEVEVELE
jgi:Holliday junction resolvase RusA-like endonuclease